MGFQENVMAFVSTTRGRVAAGVAVCVVLGAGGGLAVLVGSHHTGNGPVGQVGGSPSPGASASASASANGTPSPGASAGVTPGSGTGGGSNGGGGTSAGSGGGTGNGPVTTSSGFTYFPANLYSGAANTQGITASQINLCMHAAISLGAAFNETTTDLLVYWKMLNAHGGVIGRQVNFQIMDDAYTAQGAQQAFSECQATNPFFMMGGIGFDQDPVVRTLAEQNKMLYIYTMADDGSQGTGAPHSYKYSYTAAPTIEQVGTWMGQVAIKNDPGPYGAVYVNDANWVGGYNTFNAYLNAHGGSSVNNNSYTMGAGGDASEFNVYITELKTAGVKTVYLWMNALGADAFIKDAANQQYYPAYVTPDGFDLVTGTVGESMDDGNRLVAKPALAGWITPAFDPMNQNVPYWADEKAMLDAYKQYDSGHTPDDIDWMTWLAFKSMTDLFNTCGKNCTRNDIAGIFNSGWTETMAPLCTVDFRGNHNFGGLDMNLWVAHRVPYVSVDYPSASQHTVWLQRTTCANRFN